MTRLERAPEGWLPGAQVLLKREDEHELGAFKWRAAAPVVEAYKAAGNDAVVTASTGNHGAATAWAARRVGMRAVVFVPMGTSAVKLELLRGLGTELVEVGSDLDEAKAAALEHARGGCRSSRTAPSRCSTRPTVRSRTRSWTRRCRRRSSSRSATAR